MISSVFSRLCWSNGKQMDMKLRVASTVTLILLSGSQSLYLFVQFFCLAQLFQCNVHPVFPIMICNGRDIYPLLGCIRIPQFAIYGEPILQWKYCQHAWSGKVLFQYLQALFRGGIFGSIAASEPHPQSFAIVGTGGTNTQVWLLHGITKVHSIFFRHYLKFK